MTKPILIIGDVYREEERRHGTAFAGSLGYVLDGMLAQAGISERDCTMMAAFPVAVPFQNMLTNVVADASTIVPPYSNRPKMFLHRDYQHHVQELRRTINDLAPNIIIALGDIPLWLLTGKLSIGKNRGTPMLAGGRKLIATYHPQSVNKNWSLRPIVVLDLIKALRHSTTPTLVRPSRILHLFPSLEDIESFYHQYIVPAPILSVDVETKQGQITEVGIATSRNRAIVIPFWSRAEKDGNYWRTLREELEAWAWVRRILLEKPTLGQNFQYDMQYFYRVYGLKVPQFAGDTMLLHHAMQPEMEKGLGFLGSIYTDEPAWKFMRTDAETLKKED